jgi:deoxyadenosine/deoxycytidine kinase
MEPASLELLKKYRYISLAGLIGIGKTTLANSIGKATQAMVWRENIDQNAFVPRYYKQERVAFPMQMRFISDRLTQNLDIRAFLEKGKKNLNRVVQDRTIYEDAFVFAYYQWRIGHLTQMQYNQCCQIFKAGMEACFKPDLVLYLKADTKVILERIKSRARGYESGIDSDFLVYLDRIYEKQFLKEMKLEQVKIVRVDMNGPEPIFQF